MKSFIFFILGLLAAFGLMALIGTYLPDKSQQIANATLNAELSVQTPEQCRNLDLILTSECLHKEVSGFFNYTIRDDLDRTLQDIKTYGGDCYDYNLLYRKWLNNLGFNAELIQFDLNNETSHVITLAYTNNSYCILDQTVHPSCVVLGEGSNAN